LDRLTLLEDILGRLQATSVKELDSRVLSPDDENLLRYMGTYLSNWKASMRVVARRLWSLTFIPTRFIGKCSKKQRDDRWSSS
jgi:hypothetical protein